MTVTAEPSPETQLKDGRVVGIAGPVVDVEFPPDALPEINLALEMDAELEGHTITITAEVAQQIGDSRVRAICLKPTDVTEDQLTNIEERWEIHREPPPFDQLEPKALMFETGIKVVDLLEPYVQGGKIGLFGGAGVGKTVLI